MDCEVLKLSIILHELLKSSKINVDSKIKPSELKKKTQNSRKNSKLKRKTQFFGTFRIFIIQNHCPKNKPALVTLFKGTVATLFLEEGQL